MITPNFKLTANFSDDCFFEYNNTRIASTVIEEALHIRECEKTLLELVRSGKIGGTVHTCIGQEITSVLLCKYLRENDYVFSNHRGHGHYLARTKDYRGLIAELMGKRTGCSRGIGGSQHLKNYRFLSNGIQGGMVPVAAGAALSSKLANKSDISVVFIGDGTLGEGVVYETLNIASLWSLPLLVVVENNRIAQSTSIEQSMSGTIRGRAQAFAIDYYSCDGAEYDSLVEVIPRAISSVRDNRRPVVLEVMSHRLMAHSKGDDNRDPNLIARLINQDVLNRFMAHNPSEYEAIQKRASAFMLELQNDIEQDDDALLDVQPDSVEPPVFGPHLTSGNGGLYNNEIYESIKSLMIDMDDVYLLGEDIEDSNKYNPGSYGGAFKVTKDLSKIFDSRVMNTPISEAAIMGIANGLAYCGYRPIVEVMFGDFSTLIFDQLLQHGAKFVSMYGSPIAMPVVIRTPMGGGRGYGPTHSQSIEKHFLGIPNLDVVALNHRLNPLRIYGEAVKNITHPLLVVENKRAYAKRLGEDRPLHYEYEISNEIFPTIRIFPADDKKKGLLTIVCYGGALIDVEDGLRELFHEHEILCEVIVPSKISNTNIYPILASVGRTKRILTVEEGSTVASWSNFIISQIAEKSKGSLTVKSIGCNTLVPAAARAEKHALIGRDLIIKSILEILHGK